MKHNLQGVYSRKWSITENLRNKNKKLCLCHVTDHQFSLFMCFLSYKSGRNMLDFDFDLKRTMCLTISG